MTREEAFEEIIKVHKWYIGFCSQPYASELKYRVRTGKIKDKTLDDILYHFGYELLEPAQYRKIKS